MCGGQSCVSYSKSHTARFGKVGLRTRWIPPIPDDESRSLSCFVELGDKQHLVALKQWAY